MRKNYFLIGLLILSVTGGVVSSCSNNDEPQIPEPAPNPNPQPEEKADTIHLTLNLISKADYKNSLGEKGTRAETEITYGKAAKHYIVKGERISVYAKGTSNKIGTIVCTDADKNIFKGDIIAKSFNDKDEFYIALDNGDASNIQWDGKTFTFANAYAKGSYSSAILYNGQRISWGEPTGKGSQPFYELGRGTLNLADGTMKGYLEAITPIAITTIDKSVVPYVEQRVKEAGYTVLTLDVQTDEHSLISWTYDPATYKYTENRSDKNTRTITYKTANIQWNKDPLMLVYTMNPGMWSNPSVVLYGGDESNGKKEKLAAVKVTDTYKKMEFISPDIYDDSSVKKESYQRGFNRIIPYGALVKE